MTLTKSRLVEKLWSENLAPTKANAEELVDLVFEIMKSTLETGETVKLSGFGSLTVSSKRARLGRNPSTGEKMEIRARRVVKFKASPVLKDRVNEP